MTERQKNLVCDYGPRFAKRAHIIKTELLFLAADSASVLTDEEWAPCAKALESFVDELSKVCKINTSRMKEAGAFG